MNDVSLGILIPDRPIAFNRDFVRLGIKTTGALFLSQAVYWSRRTTDPEGWFYKVIEDWEEETGLTKDEQLAVKEKLIDFGILEVEKRGLPARNYFKVNLDELANRLVVVLSDVQSSEIPTTSRRKFPPLSITESTTESTSSEQLETSVRGDEDEEEEITFIETNSEGDEATYNGFQKAPKKEVNSNKEYDSILDFISSKFRAGKPWLMKPKQYKALKRFKDNNIDPNAIVAIIEKMVKKPYYQENGWDMNTVLYEWEKS